MENDDKSKEKIKVTRRKFVKICMGASAIAALGGSAITLIGASLPPEIKLSSLSAGFKYYANENEKKEGKLWYVDKEGDEALAANFKTGKGASTIWMDAVPAIVIKLEKGKVKNLVKGMVEEGDGVLAAFSAKCTHLCCLPNWQKSKPELDKIYCPCHDSVFDPYDIIEEEYKNEKTGEMVKYTGAKRVAGPAPRALPVIPIEIKDGKITGLPAAFPWLVYCGIRI